MAEVGERVALLEGAAPHMATKSDLIDAIADFKAEMQDFRRWVEQEFQRHAQELHSQAEALASIQRTLTTDGVKVNTGQLGFNLSKQQQTDLE